MQRGEYGKTAAIIGRIADPTQLVSLLRNPQYAGFSNVIIARIAEINRLKQAATAAQPQPPSVAQQVVSSTPPEQVQTMSGGGIIAFRDGGKVRRFKDSKGTVKAEEPERWWWGDALMPTRAATPTSVPVETPPATAPTPEVTTPAEALPPTAAPSAGIRAAAPSSDLSYESWYDKYKVPEKSLEERVAEIKKVLSPNADADSIREQLKQDAAERSDRASRAKWMGLTEAGLRMAQAASESPRAGFLGNLATGATHGLGAYRTEMGDIEKERKEALGQQIQLANMDRAERAAAVNQAMAERGQDVRSNQALMSGMFSLQKQVEASRYAADKAAAAGNSAALAANVKELGGLHTVAQQAVAEAGRNYRDAVKNSGPNSPEALEAKQIYSAAVQNQTTIANAILQHAGGGSKGITGLQLAAPTTSLLTETPPAGAVVRE